MKILNDLTGIKYAVKNVFEYAKLLYQLGLFSCILNSKPLNSFFFF